MRMSDDISFRKTGRDYHNISNEMLINNITFQKETKEIALNTPPDLRDKMESIEAGAMGFKIKDGVLVNIANEPLNATEKRQLKEATDKRMFEVSPFLQEQGLRYVNGKIELKSFDATVKDAKTRITVNNDGAGAYRSMELVD